MRCFVFLVLLLSSITVVAQEQLPLDTYTPANGLVDTRLIRMFQDSRGRIYFLTRGGFSIFDGRHFDNYGYEDKKHSGIINGISEFNDGTVKLFSFDGTVYNVRGSTVSADTQNYRVLSETNNVYDISASEKLVITNNHVIRYQNGEYKTLKTPFPGQGYLNIVDVLFCKPCVVLSHYIDEKVFGIYLYNYEKQEVTDSIPGAFFYESSSDNYNHYYLRLDSWKQLDENALQKGRLQLRQPELVKYFPEDYRYSRMFFDKDNNAWLCNNDKGYCRVSPQGETRFFNNAQGVLGSANYVFADAEKNVWLASVGNGVQKLQRSPLAKLNSAGSNSLGYVKMVNTDENGNTFIHSISGYYLNNKKIGSATQPITIPAVYWKNQYWRFTDYKTLSGSSGTVFHIEDYIPGYRPVDFQLSVAAIDHAGRLIIAGNNIFIIDTSMKMQVFRPSYFCDNAVVDKQDNYWFFLRSNKVIRLSRSNGSLQPVYTDSFPGLNPRFACAWNDSTFMVATRMDGIKILSLRNSRLTISGTIDVKNGLSNNFVYTVLKKDDRLLAGTATGLDLVSFAKKDTVVENLSLRNNIFSPFVHAVTGKDSSVICLTGDGQLYVLDKQTSLSSQFVPKPFFRSIEVNGAMADSNLVFSYDKNNFSFSISAPSFLDNKNTRYFFELTGNRQQWHQNSLSADFSINNLAPGYYHLKVRILYPGKFYPDQLLEYSFTIKKPFWLQWWFILFTVVVLGTITTYTVQAYYRRKLEKQKLLLEKELAIEQERTRMARELHDGLGSMLSGLKHSFTALQNQVTLDTRQEEKFNLNIDRLNDSIKELRNISNSMYTDNALKFGLESSLKDYCHFIATTSGLDVSFNALGISGIALSEEQSFHIFRIVQELLQNIIKHASASAVIVQLSYNSGSLYVTVEDNGKGFDFAAAKQQNGMGLKNIEARVKILKGSVEYDTGINKGTSVTAVIPCEINT